MHISGFLGTVETDDDGKIISAKAMLLTFVEEGHEDDNDELDMTLDFEEKLIKYEPYHIFLVVVKMLMHLLPVWSRIMSLMLTA